MVLSFGEAKERKRIFKKVFSFSFCLDQARKEEVKKWLMAAPSPALLAMAAHGLYVWDVHPEWSKTKFERMKKILYAKFTQHKDLQELLLGTGEKRLVEVATVDNAVNRLWGEVNGKGKNKLGELLMEVRLEIRECLLVKKIEIEVTKSESSVTADTMLTV